MDKDTELAGGLATAADAAEAAAGLPPLDMLAAVADLVDPAAVAREMPWLAGELARIALGTSDISFDQRDQRFTDQAWRTIPHLRILGQSYRLFEMWMNRMQASVDGSWQDKARAQFAADVITAALSPTNYLATNPAALRKAAETGGMSLVRGAQNMLRDLARGGMPSTADREQFVVGQNLACTPGAVVYREEMFELLQYTPTTPRVRAVPLLMIPPQINRHYILDLSPGRSLAEFAVSQGIKVFMIVWRNPDARLGHGAWGLDDYLAAEERANQVVKKIARGDKVNLLGLCAGGITLSYVLAHYAATGDELIGSATFVVTMLTGEKANVVGMLDTGQARAMLEQAAAAGQIVPGTALRSLFAMLRPNDLVYNYLVSGWLMGESPAPFDVLAWQRRCHPDHGQVRARVHEAGHGRLGWRRADTARREDVLRQGQLRQLPRRRLHRPHHGVAGLLRHRPPGRRQRQGDDPHSLRPHPVGRLPAGQHALRPLVRAAHLNRSRRVALDGSRGEGLVVAALDRMADRPLRPRAAGARNARQPPVPAARPRPRHVRLPVILGGQDGAQFLTRH